MKGKTKAIREFAKKYKNEKDLAHVVDFLNATYPYKKRFNFSYAQASKKAYAWTIALNKKTSELKPGKIKVIKKLGDNFTLVHLLDAEAKAYEGFIMNHCVASYKDHPGIYSVRDPENLPVCTIEVSGRRIEQVKGKANGKVSVKYIQYCLKALTHFKKSVSELEMLSLGYSRELDLNWVKRHLGNYKIIEFNKKKYLYTGNQLTLVRPFAKNSLKVFRYFNHHGQCLAAFKHCLSLGGLENYELSDALVVACEGNRIEMVQPLLSVGAKILYENGRCFKKAAQLGYLSIIKSLVENVEKADNKYYDENSLIRDGLVFAVTAGKIEVVKYLWEKYNFSEHMLFSLLNLVKDYGQEEVYKYLKCVEAHRNAVGKLIQNQ